MTVIAVSPAVSMEGTTAMIPTKTAAENRMAQKNLMLEAFTVQTNMIQNPFQPFSFLSI
jgi:hypothetical protein